MEFVSVRDLRTTPRDVWKRLAEDKEIIITNNGKPSALMVPINDGNFEATVKAVRQARAKIALAKLRDHAEETGLNNMSLEDINATITENAEVAEPTEHYTND